MTLSSRRGLVAGLVTAGLTFTLATPAFASDVETLHAEQPSGSVQGKALEVRYPQRFQPGVQSTLTPQFDHRDVSDASWSLLNGSDVPQGFSIDSRTGALIINVQPGATYGNNQSVQPGSSIVVKVQVEFKRKSDGKKVRQDITFPVVANTSIIDDPAYSPEHLWLTSLSGLVAPGQHLTITSRPGGPQRTFSRTASTPEWVTVHPNGDIDIDIPQTLTDARQRFEHIPVQVTASDGSSKIVEVPFTGVSGYRYVWSNPVVLNNHQVLLPLNYIYGAGSGNVAPLDNSTKTPQFSMVSPSSSQGVSWSSAGNGVIIDFSKKIDPSITSIELLRSDVPAGSEYVKKIIQPIHVTSGDVSEVYFSHSGVLEVTQAQDSAPQQATTQTPPPPAVSEDPGDGIHVVITPPTPHDDPVDTSDSSSPQSSFGSSDEDVTSGIIGIMIALGVVGGIAGVIVHNLGDFM